MATTVVPDSTIRLAAETSPSKRGYRVDAPASSIDSLSRSSWRFSAPSQPGLYPVVVTDTLSNASVRLQVFVLHPWDYEGEWLNGVRIGNYEMTPRNSWPVYEPPEGFIGVTAKNKDMLVAPHFRLDQLLCEQTEATPQHVLIRSRLLRHLERVLAAIDAHGHDMSTLHIMSGYRTAHLPPGDNQFRGGLSVYGATSQRGPFVHLDLRGRQVRWQRTFSTPSTPRRQTPPDRPSLP